MPLPPPPQTMKVEGSANPPDPRMLPDELKGDCARFFSSPAGMILLQVLRARAPDNPDRGLTAHDLIAAYAERRGYQNAVDNLSEIIHESNAPAPPTKEEIAERILTNPND